MKSYERYIINHVKKNSNIKMLDIESKIHINSKIRLFKGLTIRKFLFVCLLSE